jgi:hypothetical protein
MNQTRTAPTRFRLLGWAVGILLAGSAALGVQSLRAAPSDDCSDPILVCSIGGDQRCAECCILTGGGQYNGGQCVSQGTVCVCTQW